MLRVEATWSSALVLTVGAAAVGTGCGGAHSRYLSYMDRGTQYFAQGNLDKPGSGLRNALQILPKSPEALYLSGQIAERRGNFRSAVGLYQGALDAAPDNLPACASLARMYVMGGVPERA